MDLSITVLDNLLRKLESSSSSSKSLNEEREDIENLRDEQSKAERLQKHHKRCEDRDGDMAYLHGILLSPLLWAIVAGFLDFLLTSLDTRLTWGLVFVAIAFMASYNALQGTEPSRLFIALAAAMMLPSAISSSLTTIFGTAITIVFVLDPPFRHAREELSDHEEVRSFLIGILLALLYLAEVTAIARCRSPWSLLIITLGSVAVVRIVIKICFSHASWNVIKYSTDKSTGRISKRPFVKPLQSYIRYIAEILLFQLNRTIQWVLSRSSRTGCAADPSFRGPRDIYMYQPVPQGYIRLLTLLPGKPSQPIRCRIDMVKLGNTKKYEAVSYVWGDNSQKRVILIDEKTLRVNASAFGIIQRSRSRWEERTIWIDSVCIDQSDSAEKSVQVAFMAEIYKKAWRVTAWLGECDNAHLVQSFLANLHFLGEERKYSAQQIRESYWDVTAPRWQVFSDFFRNEWFQRVWIIQEAALGAKLHLLYGNVCMDWEYVRRGLAVFLQPELINGMPLVDGSFVSEARSLATLGVNNAHIMDELRSNVECGEKTTLSHILQLGLKFGSTKKRDKVYGVLALVSDNSADAISVSYDENNNSCAVYTSTMRHLLTQEKPLECLYFAGIGLERSLHDLPSWVPDWSKHNGDNFLTCMKMYAAGSGLQPKLDVSHPDPTMISVDGYAFDEVAHMGPVWDHWSDLSTQEVNTAQQKWFSDTEELANTYGIPYPGESIRESFVRTVLGNNVSVLGHSPSSTECLQEYDALQEYFSSFQLASSISRISEARERFALVGDIPAPEVYQAITNNIMDRVTQVSRASEKFLLLSCVPGMRVCVTRHGRLAVIPPYCLQGDIICILNGARTPFILREKSGGSQTLFQLVGFCYIHGVMGGEIKDFKLRSFVLI